LPREQKCNVAHVYALAVGPFGSHHLSGKRQPENWAIVKAEMKKKPAAEPIISPRILEMAKRSIEVDRAVISSRCAVCGAASTPLTGPHTSKEEDLCWVCRRLKISAWRDSEQLSAQE
jgi:hypothetical protein